MILSGAKLITVRLFEGFIVKNIFCKIFKHFVMYCLMMLHPETSARILHKYLTCIQQHRKKKNYNKLL